MMITLEFNPRRWTFGFEWGSFELDKEGWRVVRVKRLLLPVFGIHFESMTVNR